MYQIPELLNQEGLYHIFSTKDEGNMANAILGQVTDFPKVLDNRKKFFQKSHFNFIDITFPTLKYLK